MFIAKDPGIEPRLSHNVSPVTNDYVV